jgi:hypothetical protein
VVNLKTLTIQSYISENAMYNLRACRFKKNSPRSALLLNSNMTCYPQTVTADDG